MNTRPSTQLVRTLLLGAILVPAACAQLPGGETRIEREVRIEAMSANSIQPETTLSISAEGSVTRVPDIAFITAGVQTEAKDASTALAENSERMNGVVDALKSAGVPDRNIQTSNFSISPSYDYSGEGPARLVGYTANNMVTAKVTDLDNLGRTVDSLVRAGGNTLNGISFGLEDDTEARDEARKLAMATALARAELYAEAAGYRVARIVTISESGGRTPPMPMMMARAESDSFAGSSPVSSGELDLSMTVNVLFELAK